MFQPTRADFGPSSIRARLVGLIASVDERWPGARRRAVGIALALSLEAGILLLLMTLGDHREGQPDTQEALATFTAAPDEPDAPQAPRPDSAADARPLPPALQAPRADKPTVPPFPVPAVAQAAPSATLIPLSKSQLARADIAGIKPAAKAQVAGPIGPLDTGSPGDSQRIAGSGPHGEPLYAARWYREPGDAELAGYLSTATSPGYALINCRTVPDFRVEDCVIVSEYPTGAGLGPAVLGAAWQFRVRPPRIGGRSMVGEWVRIRIGYGIDRDSEPRGRHRAH